MTMNGFRFAAALRLLLALTMCAIPVMADEPAANPAHTVLLCGSGPSPHYDFLVGRLSEALHAKQVAVKMVAESHLSFTDCIGKATELHATSLLYLGVQAAEPENLVVSAECRTSGGQKLWSEIAKGPWEPQSFDDLLVQASKQLIEKVEAHVGEKGLETD
jgi:hypothetical protein